MNGRGRSLEHDGRRLAWRESGSGLPLLLLQGYGGTATDWDPTFLAALTNTFRVIRPDPRGLGDSSFGDFARPLSVASMAEDALVVLDVCGAGPAVVVGWSMGGFVAQELTCAAPGSVRALALMGTDGGGPDAVLADPTVWARLVDDSGSPREQASRLLHLLFPMPLADSVDAEAGELVAAARAVLDPRVLRAQEQAIDAWHAAPPPVLPLDPPPVVVVAGADDVVIPAGNVELLSRRWAGCRTEVFDGAGHAVMAQFPAPIAEHIRALTG